MSAIRVAVRPALHMGQMLSIIEKYRQNRFLIAMWDILFAENTRFRTNGVKISIHDCRHEFERRGCGFDNADAQQVGL